MLYYFPMPAKGLILPAAASIESRKILLLIVFCSTLLKLYLALNTGLYVDLKSGLYRPLNDEYSHFKYISFLIREHKLPVNEHVWPIQDREAWIFQDFEYAQPPLYYLTSIPFALLGDPVLYCRIFCIFLGVATLLLVIDSAYILFKPREDAAILIALLVGFHPIFLRIGSSISNDNLAWFLSALQFRLLLSDNNLSRMIPMTILTAAGILTKMSYLIWPLFLMTIAAWNLRRGQRGAAARAVLVVMVSLALTSWLFLRNYRLYGDFTGVIGGSGAKGAFLSSGSFEALSAVAREPVRFLFFPVAEDPAILLPFCTAVVLFFLLYFTLRYRPVERVFAEPRHFHLCAFFTFLNLALFLQANLYWPFTESRHLFIGLVPLFALGSAVLLDAFPTLAPGIAGAIQAVYLISLW